MNHFFASGGQSTGVSDGEKMETVTVFIFLGSKITADGDCSHETERHFLLERKNYEKPRMYESHSVVSDSLELHELYSPWNSPGLNIGVCSLSLLQGIFPTQGSNPSLQHCRQILYQLSHKGSSDKPRQHIKKQRHYFADKGPIDKAMAFLVVMCDCESWGIEKAEHQIIDTFELWCWSWLLTVPWTARRSSQSSLKEIDPKYSLKGLMLEPKLQYFGHLREEPTHRKRPGCWKRLKTGREGEDRVQDVWMMASLTQWTWVWTNSRK